MFSPLSPPCCSPLARPAAEPGPECGELRLFVAATIKGHRLRQSHHQGLILHADLHQPPVSVRQQRPPHARQTRCLRDTHPNHSTQRPAPPSLLCGHHKLHPTQQGGPTSAKVHVKSLPSIVRDEMCGAGIYPSFTAVNVI